MNETATSPPEPFLPADLEDCSEPQWHARALRELARQLTVRNDFYYPLIGAAQKLESLTRPPSSAIGEGAQRAQLKGISERLDGCFEPTSPMMPIVAELVPAVRDAITQLRELSREVTPAPDARARKLEEALRPFADAAAGYESYADNSGLPGPTNLHVGDLRRARAALFDPAPPGAVAARVAAVPAGVWALAAKRARQAIQQVAEDAKIDPDILQRRVGPVIAPDGGVPVPEGWRPIETAPKDGTPILITRPTAFESEERWHVVRWEDDWWTCHDGKHDSPLRGDNPTHWKVLDLPTLSSLRKER